jgi:hypothetical protein
MKTESGHVFFCNEDSTGGGTWGIPLLASSMLSKAEKETLEIDLTANLL